MGIEEISEVERSLAGVAEADCPMDRVWRKVRNCCSGVFPVSAERSDRTRYRDV